MAACSGGWLETQVAPTEPVEQVPVLSLSLSLFVTGEERLRERIERKKKKTLTGDDARRRKGPVEEGERWSGAGKEQVRKGEARVHTRALEQRCWISGEWRAPATSQRPIRAGNDVEATRRSCSRTFPSLLFVFFAESSSLFSSTRSRSLLSTCGPFPRLLRFF